MLLRYALASFVSSLVFVTAMPSFDGMASWSSIGNLVPGLTYLEGLGPSATQGTVDHVPFYLSIGATRGESALRQASTAYIVTHSPTYPSLPCPPVYLLTPTPAGTGTQVTQGT